MNTNPREVTASMRLITKAKNSLVHLYRQVRRHARIEIEKLRDWNEKSFTHLLQRKKNNGALKLIFDHRMGGGSNIFREKLVDRLIASGHASVLLVTIGRDDRQIECHLYHKKIARHKPASIDDLFHLLTSTVFDEIFINDLVTWPSPVELMSSIRALGDRYGTPITIYFHDHFFLCPSWTLLNYRDQFCGLPDFQTCDHCLNNHEDRFVTESGITSMALWRKAGCRLLERADKIICFSHYTATLIKKCFPDKDLVIVVKPHELLYMPTALPRPDYSKPLRIGVLGNIGFHKGARIVDEMSELIINQGIDAKIIIIGRYSQPVRNDIIVHGKYQRSDLADLIDEYGINVFLFPSIWPETFSYVCAEIMALKMPLVAFNLGAPAERIRDYPLGLLVDTVSAEQALQGVIDLYSKLRRGSGAGRDMGSAGKDVNLGG